MSIGVAEILLLVIGLVVTFFGLPVFRGALSVFGFFLGLLVTVYLFSMFGSQFELEPLARTILTAALGLVGGFIGIAVANVAQAVFVFLAGGLIAITIAKLVMGVPVEQASQTLGLEGLMSMLRPSITDVIWFVIGGVIFIIAMDTVLIMVMAVLGAFLIFRATDPLNLMQPEWLIPAVLGVLGLIVQQALRHRAAAKAKKVVVVKSPPPPREG